MRFYIANGWADNLINPEKDFEDATCRIAAENKDIITDWQDIRNAYTKREKVPLFTHSQVITYFVTRTVSDGLPAGDFK